MFLLNWAPDHGGLGSLRGSPNRDVMANSIFPTQRTFLSLFSGEEEDEAKLLLPLKLIARKRERREGKHLNNSPEDSENRIGEWSE